MNEDTKNKIIAILEIITASGIFLFWIGFFTVGLAPEKPPEGYFVYEHSFPLPDAVLAITLFISGILVLKKDKWGRVLSLAAGGALIFLGLVDMSFNYQSGLYLISRIDLVTNLFINLWCVIFGVAIILRLKEYRIVPQNIGKDT